ncbi:MAG: hypothetical protein WCF16_10570 [Alphaproteobacteria bacterium]
MAKKVVSVINAFALFIAAGLWFYASLLPVPDDLDAFIGALQHISSINAWAAGAAGIAAVGTAILLILDRGGR